MSERCSWKALICCFSPVVRATSRDEWSANNNQKGVQSGQELLQLTNAKPPNGKIIKAL